MNFVNAIKTCLRKYATFSGTAGRPEFWYWVLFTWILSMIAYNVDGLFSVGTGILDRQMFVQNIVIFATLLPTVAVSVRRLHDVGRSGWWFLLTFTVIGALLLLVWYVMPGKGASRTIGNIE